MIEEVGDVLSIRNGKSKKRYMQDLARDIHEDGAFQPAYVPRFNNPEKFIEAKIKMLRDHFRIHLTDEDIEYLKQFKTESEINAAVKTIFNKYWE